MSIIDISTIATFIGLLVLVFNLYKTTLRKLVVIQRKLDSLKSVLVILVDISIEDLYQYLEKTNSDFKRKSATREVIGEFLKSFEVEDIGF